MQLITDSAAVGEVITQEEAKRHLRILSSSFDAEVDDKLQAAREWVENNTARTIRPATTRTLSMCSWWSGQLKLPYPPLLTITHIKYYDASNVLQTLAAGNYAVVNQTDQPGYLEYTSTAVLPSTFDRPDAVKIEYTSGYTEATLPAKLRNAVLMRLTQLWGDAKGRDIDHAERAAVHLEYASDWGSYS